MPRACTRTITTAVLAATLALPATTMAEERATDTLAIHSVSVLGKNGNKLPGSAQALDRAALERQDYSDIHRVLREVPGVQVMEEEGYGTRPNISIRGTAMDRAGKIAVMEDGILSSPAPYSDPAAYYFPTVGRMHAVEVRKGSSQVPYGPSTTGGVLNFVSTPVPADRAGKLQLMIGEDASAKVHAYYGETTTHFGWLNVGWLAETYQQRTDGFKTLPGYAKDYPDNFQGDNTGFVHSDYLGKLRLSTAAGVGIYQELELKAGRVEHLSNETYLGLTQADFDANPYRRYAASAVDDIDVDQYQLSARYFIRPLENLDLTARVYRQQVHRNWYKLNDVRNSADDGWVSIANVLRDPTTYADQYAMLTGDTSHSDGFRVRANNRKYTSYGAQLGSEVRFATGEFGHTLNAGIRWHYDESDRFQHDSRYGMQNGVMSFASRGAPGSQDNRVSSTRALSLFAENAVEWNRLTVTPGLRYEKLDYEVQRWTGNDANRTDSNRTRTKAGTDVLVWGLGAGYEVLPGFNVFTGVHKGFQDPGPGANDSAVAEESVNFELGARYAGRASYAQATGFLHNYSNLLGRETASGGGSSTQELFNGGKARILGLELAGGHDLSATLGGPVKLPVRAAYTFIQGELLSDFESNYWGTVTKGDEIPHIATHSLLVAAGAEYGPASLDVATAYSGAMRINAGSGDIPADQKIGDYMTVDLTAGYRVSPNLRLVGSVKNLFDETGMAARTPSGLRPNMPRLMTAGIVADF